MRLAQMWCDVGVRQKKHKSPSSRHELCRLCRWDPHFCRVFGVKFGLVLLTLTSDSSWFAGCVSAQGFTIDEHQGWRALLSSWMMFGHPAACLVLASTKSFRRGYRRWSLKWSHHVSFEWNMNWIFLILNIVRSGSVRSGLQQFGPLHPSCAISRSTQTVFQCQFFQSLSRQKPTLLAPWICELFHLDFWLVVGSANPFELPGLHGFGNSILIQRSCDDVVDWNLLKIGSTSLGPVSLWPDFAKALLFQIFQKYQDLDSTSISKTSKTFRN